jgi:hypothetical protein
MSVETPMSEPNFSRHTVADIRDWQKLGRLEIQPDFQRRAVWPDAAKIMLIDSILNKYPLPKIFIGAYIKDGSTRRVVVDGQQRITAILEFLDGSFSLEKPYKGPFAGLYFQNLPEDFQTAFLSYNLDFNEFQNWSDEQIREVYNRVNKYSFSLTKQELRRADFPGDFLKLSEELSIHPFFETAKIFTPANRRRLADVEYTSELLAILASGIQDKKLSLDRHYLDFQEWPDISLYRSKFEQIIAQVQIVFSEDKFPISRTRFHQKADFYSLFAALARILKSGHKLEESKLPDLREQLSWLDSLIEPGAPSLYGEYAVRCVSDANSIGSRNWRSQFLENFLLSAYQPSEEEQEKIAHFLFQFIGAFDSGGFCPPAHYTCPICEEEVEEYGKGIVWVIAKSMLFLDEIQAAHLTCVEGNPQYVIDKTS